jgi:hypothetical protein
VWLALEAVFYLFFYLPRKNYLQAAATRLLLAVMNIGGRSGAATPIFQIRTKT